MTRVTISMKSCSRCGGDHDDVELSKLSVPFAPPECAPIAWTHWASCPTNGQPILVKVADGAEIEPGLEVPSGSESFDAALPVVYQVFLERRAALGEQAGFESTVREFFGKWKPTPAATKP